MLACESGDTRLARCAGGLSACQTPGPNPGLPNSTSEHALLTLVKFSYLFRYNPAVEAENSITSASSGLDLDVHTSGQAQLVERLDGFGRGLDNID